MSGTLYVVSTPIGHLGDLSHRAVEILKKVDAVACEDTRRTRVLLDHYGIRKPLVSYYDQAESRKAPHLIDRILAGQSLALVSDAGTPGVADPGFRLIREAIRKGVRLETVPGPSAFLAALSLSGLPTDRFAFEGFMPVKDGARRRRIAALADEDRTVIFYESPHRLLATLAAFRETLGDPWIVVARELTKKFEEVFRGRAGEAHKRFAEGRILGEFVILFHPHAGASEAE